MKASSDCGRITVSLTEVVSLKSFKAISSAASFVFIFLFPFNNLVLLDKMTKCLSLICPSELAVS